MTAAQISILVTAVAGVLGALAAWLRAGSAKKTASIARAIAKGPRPPRPPSSF